MSRVTTNTPATPAAGIGARTRVRLAVRVFLAFAVLLAVTITATSATLLYNSATTLRDEAEAAAVHLAEILSASFAEMGEISLANVARTLDATLDGQMVAQARIAAHLVAAAEAAGQRPTRIIETLDAVTATTVLDEFWITDEQAFAYLTNVRDDTGCAGAVSVRSRSHGAATGVEVLRPASRCPPAATTSSRSPRRCGRSISRSTSTSASAGSTSLGSCRSAMRSFSASRRF